jgi:hypothetical protein
VHGRQAGLATSPAQASRSRPTAILADPQALSTCCAPHEGEVDRVTLGQAWTVIVGSVSSSRLEFDAAMDNVQEAAGDALAYPHLGMCACRAVLQPVPELIQTC